MSRSHLLEALKLNPVILKDFVADIPEAALDRRRGEGYWTIYGPCCTWLKPRR